MNITQYDPLPRESIRAESLTADDCIKILQGLGKEPFHIFEKTMFALLPVMLDQLYQEGSSTRRQFINQLNQYDPNFREKLLTFSLECLQNVGSDSQKRVANLSKKDLSLFYQWLEAQDTLSQ